jgi:hypothetical protein
MDLRSGRHQSALDGFRFFEENICRNDQLTLFWIAWLKRCQGDLDGSKVYLSRYLKARFPWMTIKPGGNQVEVVEDKNGHRHTRVGETALRAVAAGMPLDVEPEAAYYQISLTLARLFEDRHSGVWAIFYGDSLGKRKSDRLKQHWQIRLDEALAALSATGSRKHIKSILAIYERLTHYGTPREKAAIREKMLPYYLKNLEFKRYSHWKHRVGD